MIDRVTTMVAMALIFGVAAPGIAKTFTLDEAVAYSLEHNKSLAAHREDIEAAKGTVTYARSSMLPRVSVEGSYQYLSEVPEINFETPPIPGQGTMTINRRMGDEDNYKAEIRARQLLFSSGKAAKALSMSKGGLAASQEKVLATEDDLARQVTETFYGVLLAQDILQATREALDAAEAHLTDVKIRYDQGAASRFELLRSEVEAANLRPRVRQAANTVEVAKIGLKALLGFDLDDPVEVRGSLSETPMDMQYGDAMQSALDKRHELTALDLVIDVKEDQAWAATADMLPVVTAFGGYSWQKPWYFEEDWTDLWTVGVGASIPIFDGMSALGKRREAQAERRRTQKEKAALVDAIDMQIKSALLDLSEVRGRIEETGANVSRAEETLKMAETGYKNGAATNLEVLDAQLALTGAKTQNIRALYDYNIARTKLLAASGRLLVR